MKTRTKYVNDKTLNIDARCLAASFNDSCAILCEWENGNEGGFSDALNVYSVTRQRIFDLLREQVGDSNRGDSAKLDGCYSCPFADFPEIRTVVADCGGGSEAAYFAELDGGWTVGCTTTGYYYAVPETAVPALPVPMIDTPENH